MELVTQDIIRNYFVDKKIIRIITSNGAILEENIINHTGEGETYFCDLNQIENGELNSEQPRFNTIQLIFEYCQKAGLKPGFSTNPLETIWRKALINIGINAFGALTHLKNGNLLNIKDLPEIMRNSILESINVAEYLNVPLLANFDYVENAFEVIKKTSKNKNSMLQDILHQRQTEIDFLNGKIVNLGESLGISTPINQIITALIKGLEVSYL